MMVLVKLISVELTFLGNLILLIEKDVTHNRLYRNGSSGLKTTKRSGTSHWPLEYFVCYFYQCRGSRPLIWSDLKLYDRIRISTGQQ